MSIDGGCWHDHLADRVGLIVRAERERLARRRPDLDDADLTAVEDTLWRIAECLLLRRARQVTVDPVAAARLWDAPVRHPGVRVPGAAEACGDETGSRRPLGVLRERSEHNPHGIRGRSDQPGLSRP